jgi:hypothetical protein
LHFDIGFDFKFIFEISKCGHFSSFLIKQIKNAYPFLTPKMINDKFSNLKLLSKLFLIPRP